MKNSILLLALFAASAANFFSFALGWDPTADYDEMEMVYVTHCRECGYPSSPGVIARDELCERAEGPLCASRWVKEKRGDNGVLAAMIKNPQLLAAIAFLIMFEIVSILKAKQMPTWEPVAMAAIVVIFFFSVPVLFFVLKEWRFPVICFFLFAAALGSYKLQGGGFVQEPDAVP